VPCTSGLVSPATADLALTTSTMQSAARGRQRLKLAQRRRRRQQIQQQVVKTVPLGQHAYFQVPRIAQAWWCGSTWTEGAKSSYCLNQSLAVNWDTG